MRKFLISLPVVFFSVGAHAADLPKRIQAEVPVSTRDGHWEGFYFGATTQFNLANGHVSIPVYPAVFDLTARGFSGGVRAGYNHQIGNWVVGLDGNVGLSSALGTHNSQFEFVGGYHEIYHITERWNGSIGPRLGYSWGSLLAYVRGGWALVNIRDHFIPPIVGVQSTTFSGWSLGGGVEYALDRHWTTNLEYRYNNYGHHIIDHNGLLRLAYTSNQMSLGVSYKF